MRKTSSQVLSVEQQVLDRSGGPYQVLWLQVASDVPKQLLLALARLNWQMATKGSLIQTLKT